MTIPTVSVTVVDGGLGLLPPAIDQVHCKVGVCSSGTANTVYSFGTKEAVKTRFGAGPLVEALCLTLEQAGPPVLGCRVTGSVAGVVPTPTAAGGNTSPAVTSSGAATDDYDIRVVVTAGGAIGTSTVKISLDGGTNYSPSIATAASYALDASSIVGVATGVTLLFASGTYVVGDSWSAQCTAPYYDSTNLGTALDAVIASPLGFSFIHVLGQADTAANSATMAAAVETKLDGAATNYRYLRAFFEVPDVSDANILAAFASTTAVRVSACAGFAYVTSALSGRVYKRNCAWLAASRASAVPIGEDLGRLARGALGGVTSLDRDERVTPGLTDARFTTIRTHVDVAGFFLTDARLLCGATSDFKYWQHGRVIDSACRSTYQGMLVFLNDDVEVNASNADVNPGGIVDSSARAIEEELNGRLRETLVRPKQASAASVLVNRTNNMITTEQLLVDVRVIPRGYAKQIVATVGFQNPAIQVR